MNMCGLRVDRIVCRFIWSEVLIGPDFEISSMAKQSDHETIPSPPSSSEI
jgi:hypothetical protein